MEACNSFVWLFCPLQVKTEISVDSKHQTLQGLAFPLQESAKRALQQLAHKRINYIQLVSVKPQRCVGAFLDWLKNLYWDVAFQRLDVEKETIELVHSNPTETRDLPRSVPKDTPRYHLFLYKHSHEGDYLESVGMSIILIAAVRECTSGVQTLREVLMRSLIGICSPTLILTVNELSALGLQFLCSGSFYHFSGLVCDGKTLYFLFFLHQCSFTPCRGTAATLKSGCSILAAKVDSWRRWSETTIWKLPKR